MEESTIATNVQYNGECAFALSTGKKGVAGKQNVTLTIDGKTYYFSNPVAKFLFKVLPGRKEKADTTYNS